MILVSPYKEFQENKSKLCMEYDQLWTGLDHRITDLLSVVYWANILYHIQSKQVQPSLVLLLFLANKVQRARLALSAFVLQKSLVISLLSYVNMVPHRKSGTALFQGTVHTMWRWSSESHCLALPFGRGKLSRSNFCVWLQACLAQIDSRMHPYMKKYYSFLKALLWSTFFCTYFLAWEKCSRHSEFPLILERWAMDTHWQMNFIWDLIHGNSNHNLYFADLQDFFLKQ